MSQEITFSAALSFLKGSASAALSKGSTKADVAGTHFASEVMSVPTTAGGTAIPTGSVTAGGWFFFQNNDATNYVEILNAVSGTKFLKLLPGECAIGRFAANVTAPAAQANTSAVDLEYLFVDA